MLVKMQGKGNLHQWLVGLQTSTMTLEISVKKNPKTTSTLLYNPLPYTERTLYSTTCLATFSAFRSQQPRNGTNLNVF